MRRAFDQFRYPSWSNLGQQAAEFSSPFIDLGPDGPDWAAPWIFSAGGAGADASVVGGEGLLVTANAAGSFHAARSTYGTDIYTDVRVGGKFRPENPFEEQYIQIAIRLENGINGWSAVNDFPEDGIALSLRPLAGEIAIIEGTAGVFGHYDDAPFAFSAGVQYNAEIQMIADNIECRVWAVGDPRPSTPTLEGVIGPHDQGFVGLSHASSAANREVYWSDIYIVDLS